jgi:hypothetical protein
VATTAEDLRRRKVKLEKEVAALRAELEPGPLRAEAAEEGAERLCARSSSRRLYERKAPPKLLFSESSSAIRNQIHLVISFPRIISTRPFAVSRSESVLRRQLFAVSGSGVCVDHYIFLNKIEYIAFQSLGCHQIPFRGEQQASNLGE